MTVATRFPKSWAVPKFDIKDPSLVLYLPFWFPYSDMAVAPGETLYSYDRNRIACVVNNALWGNRGYVLDGTGDYIDCGDVTFFDVLTQAMTFIIWINPTNFASPTNQMLMDKYDGAGIIGWSILGNGSSGKPLLAIITGSIGPPNYQIQVEANSALGAGVWECVAITYSGSGAASGVLHYQNGLSVATTIVQDGTPANDISNATTLQVGARQNTLNFVGTTGEVLIYNRALTAREILNIYSVTKWRYP